MNKLFVTAMLRDLRKFGKLCINITGKLKRQIVKVIIKNIPGDQTK